jgi:hypothetical protein
MVVEGILEKYNQSDYRSGGDLCGTQVTESWFTVWRASYGKLVQGVQTLLIGSPSGAWGGRGGGGEG